MRFIETIIDYLRGTNLKRYQAKRGHQTKKWAIKPKEGITPKKWAIKPKEGITPKKVGNQAKKWAIKPKNQHQAKKRECTTNVMDEY